MTEHSFGGSWTEEKLARLAKYLAAYRTIFTANKRARHFRTWFVDAFAGTGTRAEPETLTAPQLFEDVYEESAAYRDGSARIALGLQSPFNRYLFIEKSRKRISELRDMIATDFAPVAPRCQLVPGDANDALKNWCAARDWENERAVVFLDPYGMQVRWNTIETLAATKAVDLLYLFPLGIGVVRLLRRDGELDPAWQRRLDVLFGTPDWQDRFFQVKTVTDLFGDRETLERDASIENIEAYVQERLKSCFAGVAKGLILRNSRSSPLYLLCFASANQKGSATAVKIAQSILAD